MPTSSAQPEAASRPSILVRLFIQSHPLTTFFGASIGFGWLLTWLIAHLPSKPLILPLLAFPLSYIPALIAVIVLRVAGSDQERRAFHWVAALQNPEKGWAYLAVSTLYLMAMSVLMTVVFNQTRGSVVVMAVMHAMFDTVSIAVVPLSETTVPLLAFALGAGVAWLLVLGVLMLTGADLGGPSHRRARPQEPTQRSTGEPTNV